MAMSVRRCNTERITRCSMTRALPEALDAAIGQLLAPYRPGSCQGDNHYEHVPTLLAILMAIAMRRCYTLRIARWRRFVAFIKATKRHHRTSTRSDRVNRSSQCCYFRDISSSNC
jgi:hypothetical protein